MLLAYFKDGTTWISKGQSPRYHSYSFEEENDYQTEKGRAKIQETWVHGCTAAYSRDIHLSNPQISLTNSARLFTELGAEDAEMNESPSS